MNEPSWIILVEWTEWGETASREFWVEKSRFPNASDAVEFVRDNEFGRNDVIGIRRVEDSITCDKVEWWSGDYGR